MKKKQEVLCRYAGYDLYGNELPPDRSLGKHQKLCEKGTTCNRPWDPMRDEFGLNELEERQHINAMLLREWNVSLRSPYCQCKYPSGNRPKSGCCSSCNRPMDSPTGAETDHSLRTDSDGRERIRRLHAGPTWIIVYENVVRAAELALKLLIKATGPAAENDSPAFGKHDLRDLWKQVPRCAQAQVIDEICMGHHFDNSPHAIRATGEIVSEPMPITEQPVFGRFAKQFDSVRYAWDDLAKEGLNEVNEQARKWPNPMDLYYLYSATGVVLSVLQRHPWDRETRGNRWDRRVQLVLGLDESTFHSDWPRTFISMDTDKWRQPEDM